MDPGFVGSSNPNGAIIRPHFPEKLHENEENCEKRDVFKKFYYLDPTLKKLITVFKIYITRNSN